MKYRFLRYPGGKCKAVTLSYDDGVRDDLKLVRIINKYGLKCTFNYTNIEHITKEEVLDNILHNGHEIAVHGAEHRAEGVIRPIEGISDVLLCRRELENRYNLIIRGMAYPDSGISNIFPPSGYSEIKAYLKALDIAYARTIGGDNDLFRLPEDWYAWIPTAHHSNPDMMEHIEKFLKISMDGYRSTRYPRLLYIWGHSYEFERNDNWELLEAICQKLSGKDEIWYATNLEIYNYVQAYNSLSFSADGHIIYNPTIYTIWFDIDGTLYNICSGETLRIDYKLMR